MITADLMSDTAVQSAPISAESFLLEVADVVNTTLDLDTLLSRVAELVRRVIDYEIFAIILLNEKTQELRMRFQIGHPPEVAQRFRIKVGEGITGTAAATREPVLVNDVTKDENYVGTLTGVRSELAIPLIVKNRVIGVIDLEAPQPGYFREEHKRLLTVVASRIAIGIENARLYTRVARQARTLALLNTISRDVSSVLNLDQLLSIVGDQLKLLIDYQMFSILLLDPTETKLEHRFSLRFNESIQIKSSVPMGKGLVGYAAQHKEPVLVADVCKDPRYIQLNPETRSELCVPLIYKGKAIGVLDIEHTRRAYFTEEHMRTITILAGQVAVAIENARLYERIARQEQQLERDLQMASELQVRLLPTLKPQLKNAELCARFEPARAIGGDLYDFLSYSKGVTGIAIGDVSGKGSPAALYAALSSGVLRSHAVSQPGPAEMLSRMNVSLNERRLAAQFLSMIFATWHDAKRTLRIANSGLPRPIFCHDGKLECIEATGLPLGLFEQADYDEFTYHAKPGDLFVFFSDGILDAANADGHLFGRHRLEEVITQNCGRPACEMVAAVFDAVAEHSAGMSRFDDQTVVALRVQ